jgi:hypothetical protein
VAESDGEVYKRHCRVMGKATTRSNWREARGRERESKGKNTPTIDGLKRVLRQAKWRGPVQSDTRRGGPGHGVDQRGTQREQGREETRTDRWAHGWLK